MKEGFNNNLSVASLVERGVHKVNQGDYRGAIADFNLVLRSHPQSGSAYHAAAYAYRGDAQIEIGNYWQAIEDYTQAIRLNPDDATYNNRGVVRSHLKDYKGAIKDFNYAILINPNQADAYISRSNVYIQQGDIRGAIEDLQTAASFLLEQGDVDSYQRTTNDIRKLQLELQQQRNAVEDNKLVIGRDGSRAVLMEALERTQSRLIIICPWLSNSGIKDEVLRKFRDILEERNSCIDIGWGYRQDWEEGTMGDYSHPTLGWKYSALPKLRELEQKYPSKFRLKALGTHEKTLVCDCAFALIGSHNLLTSSAKSDERESGVRITNLRTIQDLINNFDTAPVLEI